MSARVAGTIRAAWLCVPSQASVSCSEVSPTRSQRLAMTRSAALSWRVIVSPHTASHTLGQNEAIFGIFLDNLARFRAGQALRNDVDNLG